MRKSNLATLNFLLLLISPGKGQNIDTLIDVDGYRLHFYAMKGKGMPILFEGGSRTDVTGWNTVLKPIADIT